MMGEFQKGQTIVPLSFFFYDYLTFHENIDEGYLPIFLSIIIIISDKCAELTDNK